MTKMLIEKKIGQTIYRFEVEGETLHEMVMEAKKLSFPNVLKCGLCGDDRIYLDAHVAKDKFKYTTIKCGKCKGSLNFGQQTADPSIVYLKTKEGSKEYDWRAYDQPEQPVQQTFQQPQNPQGYQQPQQNYPNQWVNQPQGYQQPPQGYQQPQQNYPNQR